MKPRCQHVADGVHVAERLGHFLAVDEQVLDVEPVAHEGQAGRGLALRDFVFVVRKAEVGAAAVDVDLRPEMLHAQRGTFDVPAGPALAPGRIPADVAVGLDPFFPEDEIADAFLLVLVLVDPRAGDQAGQVEMAEAAVLRKRRDAEIDRAVVGDVGRLSCR